MYDFGLTDAQFWDLTPARFNALSRRVDAEAEAADLHTARLSWAVMTAAGARRKDGSALTVLDFRLLTDDPDPADPAEAVKTTLIGLFGLPAELAWTRHPPTEGHGG